MNKALAIQKKQLQTALSFANTIEICDENIACGRHVNYYQSTRSEAIQKYADAVAEIIESSIDIAVEYESKPPFTSEDMLKQFDIIADDYRKQHGITY